MNSEFEKFLTSLPELGGHFDDKAFVDEALQALWLPLAHYLQQQLKTDNVRQFSHAVSIARRLNDAETGRHFWDALLALQSGSLLKFTNVIERLQQYSGSQIFPIKNIAHKRRARLYLAVALSWEHLRYLAGEDDDYSPSGDLLEKYGVTLDDHEH